ncbi:hypothetical protein [Klenkia marina]|uniref:hypothetical protein n=1 Tax=Klenkia marina TaxID=1960309 RepID=UPI001059239E|nr:hypothetical protein [Klenkia marina]
MPTYLTCAVVQTPEAYSFGMDLALRMDAPEGTTTREDPHVPGTHYVESTVQAPDLATALTSSGLAVAGLVAGAGLPGEVVEITVLGDDGAVTWVPGVELPAADLLVPEAEHPGR